MYNTNWITWVRENAHIDLRLPRFLAWVVALIKPIRTIDQGEFSILRFTITQEYRWNGSVNSLTKQLNDIYDPIERRIYFENVPKTPVLYHTGANEQATAYYSDGQFEEYFRLGITETNESQDVPYEIKVLIHESINFIPERILDLLDIYLFAGIRPRLFTYTDGGVETEIITNYDFLGNG
jgi:hypothetical protein